MSWSLREHRNEPDRLAHLLYWHELKRPRDVIYQTDRSLMGVIAYHGPDMESSDLTEIHRLNLQMHTIFRTFDAGWCLQFEDRPHVAPAYPVSSWNHPVPALVDEERRAQVGIPNSHFETAYHLTLTYHLPSPHRARWQNIWWKNIPEGHAQVNEEVRFRDRLHHTCALLADIFPRAEVLEGKALLTYLKKSVSFVDQPVAMPSQPWNLRYKFTDTEFFPGAVPKLGDNFLRMIFIKGDTERSGFPETVYPGILDILHELPFPYRFMRRMLPLSYTQASKELRSAEKIANQNLKRMGTRLEEKATGEASNIEERNAKYEAQQAAEAREMLERGLTTFGYLTLTIMVWDEDYAVAEEKRKLVEQTLQAKGFIAGHETFNSVESFLGMIPGDSYHNVRKPMVDLFNVVDLTSTTSMYGGPTWCPHLNGSPLMVGTGRGNTHVRIVLHHGDVGDFWITGNKGSGKSTLHAFMTLQWQKYANARNIIWDKDQSLKATTLAMDGTWLNVTPGEMKPLQPLAHIDQERELVWANEWLSDVLDYGGIPLTPAITNILNTTLRKLAGFAPQHRTLSGFVGLVQSQELRDALEKYTLDGMFGSLLDGDHDALQIGRFHCFELADLLKTPRALAVIAPILFHVTENALEGDPTMISIEEFHAFEEIASIRQRVRTWIKTLRKRNAILGIITPSIADMAESNISMTIFSEFVSRFFCADPHATEERIGKLYSDIGLSERQRELIASLMSKREYYYVGQGMARKFALSLGPIGQSFCGRSRQEDLRRIAHVEATRTEPFGVAWLRDENMDDVADVLKESYNQEVADETGVSRH